MGIVKLLPSAAPGNDVGGGTGAAATVGGDVRGEPRLLSRAASLAGEGRVTVDARCGSVGRGAAWEPAGEAGDEAGEVDGAGKVTPGGVGTAGVLEVVPDVGGALMALTGGKGGGCGGSAVLVSPTGGAGGGGGAGAGSLDGPLAHGD